MRARYAHRAPFQYEADRQLLTVTRPGVRCRIWTAQCVAWSVLESTAHMTIANALKDGALTELKDGRIRLL